jgi:hypothetical protein
MTNDPTSSQQDPTNSFTIANLLGGLISAFVMVAGNDFMIEFVGSHVGKGWLSEYIERHQIWANIIYFFATLGVFALSVPFINLMERTKRDIFILPQLILLVPLSATVFAGIYRSIVILWNVSSPAVQYLFATDLKRVFLCILIVAISITSSLAAYLVRTFSRTRYGLVELAFGVGSIVFSVYSVVVAPFAADSNRLTGADVWQAIFGFVAGVYIIVRGLVSIEEGLKQGPLTPRKVFRLLASLIAVFPTKIARWLSLLFRPISPDS